MKIFLTVSLILCKFWISKDESREERLKWTSSYLSNCTYFNVNSNNEWTKKKQNIAKIIKEEEKSTDMLIIVPYVCVCVHWSNSWTCCYDCTLSIHKNGKQYIYYKIRQRYENCDCLILKSYHRQPFHFISQYFMIVIIIIIIFADVINSWLCSFVVFCAMDRKEFCDA